VKSDERQQESVESFESCPALESWTRSSWPRSFVLVFGCACVDWFDSKMRPCSLGSCARSVQLYMRASE